MKAAKPGRASRVADQIAKDLAQIIPQEVRDPRVGMVTITGCEITPDYAHATVYFTVLGAEPEECRQGLEAAAGLLHNAIFKKLRIHTVPRLHFKIDESIERGFAMDRVIDRAMQATRENEKQQGK